MEQDDINPVAREHIYLQDTREIIAENLLTRREQLKKTQEALSEEMGYTRCWYQKREQGKAEIGLEDLPRLMEVLQFDDPMLLFEESAFSKARLMDLL